MALNRREKALLSLPVVVAGGLAFYNWVHEPLFQRRAEVATKVEQVALDLMKEKAKADREGDLTSRVAAVTVKEQKLDAWVPGKNSAALLVWYLSEAERYSGAKVRGISFSSVQQVPASQAKSGAKADPGAAARPDPNAAPKNAQGAAKPPLDTMLTVVRLDLKVDAHFVEHLLFNQAVEQLPLFVSTDSLGLKRSDKLPMDGVGKLLQDGNLAGAESLLAASPPVEGTYHINLYFKGAKAGPATAAMAFADGTGRRDPFAMEGVAEFVDSVNDYLANPASFNTGPDGSAPITAQMG